MERPPHVLAVCVRVLNEILEEPEYFVERLVFFLKKRDVDLNFLLEILEVLVRGGTHWSGKSKRDCDCNTEQSKFFEHSDPLMSARRNHFGANAVRYRDLLRLSSVFISANSRLDYIQFFFPHATIIT